MRIESLSIIFIIIILPIAIVLSEYIDKKIETEKLEMQYNNRLLSATQDAINAYQLNTVNNSFGDVTNSKIKDVESATKVFFNSLAANFNYIGYKQDTMKDYVPAVVFTMYDGYYIYSPFNNTLTEVTNNNQDYSEDEEIFKGLKPYVYYSCRYTRGANDDFIITYTLDNYITIQGQIGGKYIYDYGYLYSIGNNRTDEAITKVGDSYWYNGIEFTAGDTERLKEYVGNTEYSYVKINGKKYYLDENAYNDRGSGNVSYEGETFKASTGIFYIDEDGTKNYNQTKGYSTNNTEQENKEFIKYYRAITKNKSAYEYYKNAYEFSSAVLGTPVTGYKDKAGTDVTSGYGLKTLEYNNSEFYNNPLSGDATAFTEYGNKIIFDDSTTKIQKADSNFNEHRKAIIRYVVESNLSASISGFSSNAKTTFIMPKISETDWEIIQNDSCAITFMQGMSIGIKKYNGYKVISNTYTKEHIDEDDIYILKTDNTYGTVNEDGIASNMISGKTSLGYYAGIWKLNFERKYDVSTASPVYYIPMSYQNNGVQTGYLGSYTSIVGDTGITSNDIDMYTYVNRIGNTNLKKTYYAALGRERCGSFNINNINYELYGNNGNEYFLKDYE